MQNIIAVLVIFMAVGTAARYVYRAKKNGVKCIGCSAGSCCCAGKTCTCTDTIEACKVAAKKK